MMNIKKLLIPFLTITITSLALAGCSLQQKVGSAANTLVGNYCTKPAAERALVRVWIDQATTPNKIRVTCAGDEATPETPQATTPQIINE